MTVHGRPGRPTEGVHDHVEIVDDHDRNIATIRGPRLPRTMRITSGVETRSEKRTEHHGGVEVERAREVAKPGPPAHGRRPRTTGAANTAERAAHGRRADAAPRELDIVLGRADGVDAELGAQTVFVVAEDADRNRRVKVPEEESGPLHAAGELTRQERHTGSGRLEKAHRVQSRRLARTRRSDDEVETPEGPGLEGIKGAESADPETAKRRA